VKLTRAHLPQIRLMIQEKLGVLLERNIESMRASDDLDDDTSVDAIEFMREQHARTVNAVMVNVLRVLDGQEPRYAVQLLEQRRRGRRSHLRHLRRAVATSYGLRLGA
jgi:hypothetical protein